MREGVAMFGAALMVLGLLWGATALVWWALAGMGVTAQEGHGVAVVGLVSLGFYCWLTEGPLEADDE